MNYKICTECNRSLPATNDFFSKMRRGKYGLYAKCKLCVNKKYDPKKRRERYPKDKQQEWYKKNKEKKVEYVRIHKYIRKIKKKQNFCTICNISQKLELASINHIYTEDPNDYLWLCRSCHLLFDQSIERYEINESR